MRREVLICLLLAGITLGLYWPATQCDFVHFDDQVYVTENAHVQSGLTPASVAWAFSTSVSSNWHPLTMLSLMLDYQLFGLKPWGYHLTNLLLHTLNTILVFLLLRRLTGFRTEASGPSTLNPQPSTALWLCAAVAALFGWHPLHVESVAWVSERKDVLSTCCFLLSLLAYVRFAEERSQRWRRHRRRRSGSEDRSDGTLFGLLQDIIGHRHKGAESEERMAFGLSLGAFALGLMCKPMLVTLPFVLLLLDYWPLKRFPISPPAPGSGATSALRPTHSALRSPLLWRLVFEKLPFFALAATACAVTFAVQNHGGAVVQEEALPLGDRLENVLISYCRYLGKIFWPTNLAIYYPLPGHWPWAEVLLAVVFLSCVSVLFIIQRHRHPWLLMGWCWFLGTLVPVIGLVQVGEQSMADRYTYIPSLGVFMLIVLGAYESCRRWRYHVIALSVAGSAALACCCLLTWQQLGYWKSSEALFRHAAAVTENNALAFNNLGFVAYKQGRMDEAIACYQQAVRFRPAAAEYHNNLGLALLAQGRTEEAIAADQEALRLKPDFARAHFNLANALSKKGQLDEAIAQYNEGLGLDPGDPAALANLARLRGFGR